MHIVLIGKFWYHQQNDPLPPMSVCVCIARWFGGRCTRKFHPNIEQNKSIFREIGNKICFHRHRLLQPAVVQNICHLTNVTVRIYSGEYPKAYILIIFDNEVEIPNLLLFCIYGIRLHILCSAVSLGPRANRTGSSTAVRAGYGTAPSILFRFIAIWKCWHSTIITRQKPHRRCWIDR